MSTIIDVFGLPAKKAVKKWLGINHVPTIDMMREAYLRMLKREPGTEAIAKELGLDNPLVLRRVEAVTDSCEPSYDEH